METDRGEEMVLPKSEMTTDKRGRSPQVAKSTVCLHFLWAKII